MVGGKTDIIALQGEGSKIRGGGGRGRGLREGKTGRGEGGAHLLLALALWPLRTHPIGNEAAFLLPTETPPTFGRPLRFFHIPHTNCFASAIFFLIGGKVADRWGRVGYWEM